MKKVISAFSIFCLTSVSAFAAGNYSCGGTEPFWNLQIRGNKISYSDAERKIPEIKVKEVQNAAGTTEDFFQLFKAGTPGGYPVTVIVNGNPSCTDGMSDETYSHQVIVQISGGVLFGCCKKD